MWLGLAKLGTDPLFLSSALVGSGMESSRLQTLSFYPQIQVSSPTSSTSSPTGRKERRPQITPDGIPSPERPDVLSDGISIFRPRIGAIVPQ